MRKPTNSLLGLRKSSLTAHTFITGSTGAGKSNTIYTLLDRLCLGGKSDTHFLVIEPAKGEYKDTLGGHKGVSVYGTNPKKTQLLRLNPFAFPEDIHVLEHIDRLIEIFNACWPMYAAMPAVLKSAVENAYSNVGWSLNASSNPSGRVPTFRDVMDALPQVIRTKGFSKDTQGDYEGALLTRVESLTNGINGQVLCSCDPVQDEALFDENVIVDLSRVGSMETKALLMGILVLKLQEHRMAQRSAGKNKPNSGLAHITVLEEAHNLLRRTSSEQSQESANLQGKSVEMLTNAIAELRSFGEGFVIADQSPGLLDMAVIRNTNTKIIMRLPDEGDRQLVGRAAGLNDDQIVELSKLETGVAAIYQNEWLEPVLCKVDRFGDEKVKPFDYKKQPPDAGSFYPTMFSLLCGQTDYCELTKEQVDAFYRWVERISIREELKETLCTAVEDKKQVPNPDATLYVLVSGDTLFKATSNETPTDTIAQRLMERYQLDNLELVRLMSEHLVNMQIRLGRMEQTASSIEKMPGERWR
ncbi:MAG: ATP-binding protein [Oscillospiraceae bacterium]